MDKIINENTQLEDVRGEDSLHNINVAELTQDELESLTEWLKGESTEMPEFLRVISAQLSDKINFGMNYVLASYMRRIFTLTNYIEDVEKDIYTEESLLEDSLEDKNKKYSCAIKTLNSLLAFTNNYKYKNKEQLGKADDTTQMLSDMLLGLSKDRIESIINAINQGKI